MRRLRNDKPEMTVSGLIGWIHRIRWHIQKERELEHIIITVDDARLPEHNISCTLTCRGIALVITDKEECCSSGDISRGFKETRVHLDRLEDILKYVGGCKREQCLAKRTIRSAVKVNSVLKEMCIVTCVYKDGEISMRGSEKGMLFTCDVI